MCNDFGNRVSYREYVEEFSQLRLPVVFPPPEEAPNLEPRDEIWPTDSARVIVAAEGGVALHVRQWGLAPGRPKAEMYVQGVSTRKVKAVTEALCGHSFSASAISTVNTSLDAALTAFAERKPPATSGCARAG